MATALDATLTTSTTYAALTSAKITADKALADATASGASTTAAAANVAALDAAIAAAAGTPATAAVADETKVVSRARLQFDASTTTDAGISLNYRQRIQTEENGTNSINGARFGLSVEGVSLNVGNINGVIESTPGLYLSTKSAGVGLEGNGYHSLALNNAAGSWGWTAYSSGGAGADNGVEVIYSANGIRLHAHDTSAATAYGASFSMSGAFAGVGYEDFDDGSAITLITAGMSAGGASFSIAHGITEDTAGVETKKTSLSGGYDVAPGMNVYGFVATEDAGDASGVGMSMDMGGGSSFEAGYTNTAAGRGILSAGLFFSF